MKIVKPNWINHDGQPIFSIDIHPDGSRMATSGQGESSGKIVIWNMGPIINKSKEIDENVPKILCQMDHHMGCVNTVRWSNNGQFLASGADDKLIMIWQYVPSPTYQNIENWKCAFTLRGHSGDVLDLAWSFNDAYLASSSVDNYIFIWNVLKFPDVVARINAHNGFVKGITWDPIGQYIASQSDDKTLKIWKTCDWTLEKCIEEPFKKCGNTTHMLRLNWSPDGQLLISAHAMNNNAPTAQVIERCGWKTKLDFIGHRQAITCVKFYPQILKETNGNADKTYCLCAVGSRDKALSIWLTNYTRPISVIYDLFTNPVMDVTWCKEPCGLLCCSMDGTVAYIEFNSTEVGFPLTKNEMDQFYKLKYSYDLIADIAKCHSTLNSSNVVESSANNNKLEATNQNKFIENIDVLIAQENAKQIKQKQQEQQQQQQISNLSLSSSASSDSSYAQSKRSSSVENQKQIERKMSDGRRRITPICISKTNEFETPKPFDSVNNLRSQTATEESTIVIEKRDERGDIIDISPVKHVSYTLKPSSINSNSNDTQFYLAIKQKQQQLHQQTVATSTQQIKETIEKLKQEPTQPEELQPQQSKQQEQATNLPKPQEPTKVQPPPSQQATPKPQTTTSPNQNNTVNKAQTQQPATIKKPPFQTPTAPATTTNGPNQIKSQTPTTTLNKQPQQQQQQQTQSATTRTQPQKRPIQQQQPQTPVVNGTSHLKPPPSTTTTTTTTAQKSSESLTPVGVSNDDDDTNRNKMRRIIKTSPSIHLLALKFDQNRVTKQISTKIGDKSSTEIEIENNINDQRTLNCVKYIKDRVCKWKQVINSEIIATAHSQHIIICASHDRCLYLINIQNGKQICCPILVDDQVTSLKCNNNYCMCLTCNATIYIWKYDIEQIQSILNQSCLSVVREGHFINSTITDNGMPVIYMSNSRTYFYSFQTKSWHLIPSLNNDVSINSYIESFSKDQPMGPLSQIQVKDSNADIIKTIDQLNKNNTLKQDCTINYLESQMNASLAFNSSKEYKFWLQTYTRYLCENSYEDKLKDLCSYLLGPIYSIKWNPKILDLNKRELLNDILNIIINYTNFERIYTQYRQQLSSINTNTSILNGIVSNYETTNKTVVKLNGEQASVTTTKTKTNNNDNHPKQDQPQQQQMQTD